MKRDNSGFTLVELIICLVIFALVVATAFGFMLGASRSYTSVSGKMDLQLQSQLTMNQLREYIIDCNAGLYYKNNTVYIINKESDGSYTANVFQYKSDGCIYYGKGPATLTGSGTFSCTVTGTDLLADGVTSFSVTPKSSDGANVSSAAISITFKNNSATCNGVQTVALRNTPPLAVVS